MGVRGLQETRRWEGTGGVGGLQKIEQEGGVDGDGGENLC